MVPDLIFTLFALVSGNYLGMLLVNAMTGIVAAVLFYARKRVPTKIDQQLVSLLMHMYAVSLGQVGPDDLVQIVAETEDYGYYSKVFSKIREIGKEYGYGVTKATSEMAKLTKPPFRDVLIRCQQAFASIQPRGYLELEASTIIEEYAGYYERAIKSIELLGGVYSTFSSVSIFIVMILDILVVFTNDINMVYVGYFVSATCLIMLYVGFKTVVPKDILVHIDKEMPPKSYNQFKLTLPIAFACIVPSILMGMAFSPPYAFLMCGIAFLIPGLFAYRLETLVLKVDENYPTLIKGLGESMASSSSLENALFYVLYLELGRLKNLVKRAFARVKIGSTNAKALTLLSAEAASHNVYTSNKIFLDAFSRGADLLAVGKILGSHCVRNLQIRKKREAIAKSLVTVTFLLQPITVVLLTVLTHLTTYFSQMLTAVPYFTFGQIPLDVIFAGNIFMIVLVTLLNSFTLKDARGGFWGTSLLYISILLILSGGAWLGAEMLMSVAFGGAFGGVEGILGAV
ncbi:MAG TPA: hypothetical protein VIH48_02755 [Candidatus Bathyarchaeia archaeon]